MKKTILSFIVLMASLLLMVPFFIGIYLGINNKDSPEWRIEKGKYDNYKF